MSWMRPTIRRVDVAYLSRGGGGRREKLRHGDTGEAQEKINRKTNEEEVMTSRGGECEV